MFGYQAGLLNTASNNVFIGSAAGATNAAGTGQTFVGYQAGTNVTGNNNTVIGNASAATLTTGTRNVVIGSSANVQGSGNLDTVVVGGNSTGRDRCVLIGSNSNSGANDNIVIGSNLNGTASNQFVAGGTTVPMNDVYFGRGVTDSSATAYTINGTGGSGSNNAGAALQLAGGKGTGTAEPGLVVLKYPLKTTTGSTLQNLSTQNYVLGGTLFSQTTTVTKNADNTTETSMLSGTIVGSKSIEGGLLRAGRMFKLTVRGTLDTGVTAETLQIRVKMCGITIYDTGILVLFGVTIFLHAEQRVPLEYYPLLGHGCMLLMLQKGQ
jgi:hypothetical protein